MRLFSPIEKSESTLYSSSTHMSTTASTKSMISCSGVGTVTGTPTCSSSTATTTILTSTATDESDCSRLSSSYSMSNGNGGALRRMKDGGGGRKTDSFASSFSSGGSDSGNHTHIREDEEMEDNCDLKKRASRILTNLKRMSRMYNDDNDGDDDSSDGFSYTEYDITLVDDSDINCDPKNEGEMMFYQVLGMLRFEQEVGVLFGVQHSIF